MKANVFMLVMAFLIGLLFSYGLYTMGATTLQFIGGGVLCTLALMFTIGVSIREYPRSTILFRTLAGGLFGVLLIVNLLFVWFSAEQTIFIIINGLLTVGGAIGLWQIYQSKQ